jgi:hypothetical protein
MQITNKQFQTRVQRLDVSKLSDAKKDQAVKVATSWLVNLHRIESIERIGNLAGAIGLLEGRMLAILRSAGAEIPEYEPHASQIDAFLDGDDPFSETPNVHGKSTADEIAAMF